MEVPEMVAVAVSLLFQALLTDESGTKMSTQFSYFEQLALASLLVVAPTVTAPSKRAGELLHASLLEFPAATTT